MRTDRFCRCDAKARGRTLQALACVVSVECDGEEAGSEEEPVVEHLVAETQDTSPEGKEEPVEGKDGSNDGKVSSRDGS